MADYTWYAMPEQQQMRVDGHEGAGHGGSGSYGGGGSSGGGGGGGDRDRQDVARETRERETGSIYGGGAGGGTAAPTSTPKEKTKAQRQTQVSRMMSAQHRDRRARGPIGFSGLSTLSEMERGHEQETQEKAEARRATIGGIIGAAVGALFGLPGVAVAGKGMAKKGAQDRIDAGMEAFDETGMLSERGGWGRPSWGPGGHRDETGGWDQPEHTPAAAGAQPKPPETPPTPQLQDPYDQYWLDNFGIDPTDPRLQDPFYDPFKSPAAALSKTSETPAGNPTLAYMGQVSRDIERSRERRKLASGHAGGR